MSYIDKQQNGGALWIIGSSELTAIVQKAKDYEFHFVFAKDEGKAAKGKLDWWMEQLEMQKIQQIRQGK